VGGPSSFNYTLEPAVVVSATPVTLNYVGEGRFVGPRDPAAYPMIATTSSSGISTVSGVFYRTTGCRSLEWCGGFSNAASCSPILLCPDQSVKFTAGDPGASGTTEITSLTSIPKVSLSVSGENMTAGPFNFTANSVSAVLLTFPTNTLYQLRITWNASRYAQGASFYYGGCDGKYFASGQGSRYSSNLEVVDIPQSATLILRMENVDQSATFSFTRTPSYPPFGTCVQSSSITNENYAVPPICQGKVANIVGHPSSIAPIFIPKANESFVKLFPEASAACYNAYMAESCNSIFQPCTSAGVVDDGYLCPDSCAARVTAAGCTDPAILALCQFHVTKCAPGSSTSLPPAQSQTPSSSPSPQAASAPKSTTPGTNTSVASSISQFSAIAMFIGAFLAVFV
jgi:hypothetical protein